MHPPRVYSPLSPLRRNVRGIARYLWMSHNSADENKKLLELLGGDGQLICAKVKHAVK